MKLSKLISALTLCLSTLALADDAIEIPSSISSLYDSYTTYTVSPCKYDSHGLFMHALLFVERFLYPANSKQAEAINSTMFSEDVVGRIDITREYDGRELNTEYLFGLFVSIANTNITNIFGYATDYNIYEFNGLCNQYTLSVVFNTTFPLFNNAWIPFEANIWVKLNDDNQITQYDLQFRKWPVFYDYVLKQANGAITGTFLNSTQQLSDSAYDSIAELLASSICGVHEEYCTGDNKQYDSTDDCMDFLTSIRFGNAMEGGRDTLFCRSLHQNMVSYRPSVHCAHIGPGGGDMCVDDEATEYFNAVYGFDDIFSDAWIVLT